jgi:hypothetical protein
MSTKAKLLDEGKRRQTLKETNGQMVRQTKVQRDEAKDGRRQGWTEARTDEGENGCR